MCNKSIIGLNPVLRTEIPDSITVELGVIVYDESVWNPKPTQDVVVEEVSNSFLCDLSHSFCFDPLSKVVASNNNVLLLTSGLLQRTHNIKAPLCEWPRAGHTVKE